jgi:hypothetical protein
MKNKKAVDKKNFSAKAPVKIDDDILEGIFELLGLDTDGEVILNDNDPLYDPDRKKHEIDREYLNEKRYEQYHTRKAEGLCPRCGKPQDTEKVHCDPCLCRNRVFKAPENNDGY